MRNTTILVLLCIACFASATFRDKRTLHPVAPLSQEEVARQQALQRQQSPVGTVPTRTDDTGYAPRSEDDSGAAAIVANAKVANSSDSASSVIKTNADVLNENAEHPKRVALGALWALLAGLLVAVGAWVGLQKFGAKPPDHVLREN